MSVETDLLTGIAQTLAAAGVGAFGAGPYASTDTAIVFGEMPAQPDRCIGLTVYSAQDNATVNYTQYRVQVWARGVPNVSTDAADIQCAVFDALHGLTSQQWGSVWVSQVTRYSLIPAGVDANRRSERSDNYLLRVNPPNTAHRPL